MSPLNSTGSLAYVGEVKVGHCDRHVTPSLNVGQGNRYWYHPFPKIISSERCSIQHSRLSTRHLVTCPLNTPQDKNILLQYCYCLLFLFGLCQAQIFPPQSLFNCVHILKVIRGRAGKGVPWSFPFPALFRFGSHFPLVCQHGVVECVVTSPRCLNINVEIFMTIKSSSNCQGVRKGNRWSQPTSRDSHTHKNRLSISPWQPDGTRPGTLYHCGVRRVMVISCMAPGHAVQADWYRRSLLSPTWRNARKKPFGKCRMEPRSKRCCLREL